MRPVAMLSVLLAGLIHAGLARAEPLAESGETKSRLIELYTSEGCSSCPPADRWFSTLTDHPDLWETLVPVAFHVDYWDYIGWEDRFAEPAYGQRQRVHARQNGMPTVYTPGLIENGEEWRNFSWKPPRAATDDAAGTLSLRSADAGLELEFIPPADGRTPRELTAYAALLGFGLSSRVSRGENAGRRLTHDFVVLDLVEAPMRRTATGYAVELNPPASDVDAERFAVAAWVSPEGRQAPLQATGGWLHKN